MNFLKVARVSLSMVGAPAATRTMSTRMEPLLDRTLDRAAVFRRFETHSHLRLGLAHRVTHLGAVRHFSNSKHDESAQTDLSISDILDREIQEETAELNQHLTTDQFPGFSVETNDADVKLTRDINGAQVTVRFTVSSSLTEWPTEQQNQQEQSKNGDDGSYADEDSNTTLVSTPEFQVQISRGTKTLEVSCYFEDSEPEEEFSGQGYPSEPMFLIDELVMYEGEPKETEFAVNAEYFQGDLQAALLQYLARYGVDDEFGKNLVKFATGYEKKQYIGLMRRLRSFVAV